MDAKILGVERVKKQLKCDDGTAFQMVFMFSDMIKDEIDSLKRAFARKDLDMLYELVHRHFGALCYVGSEDFYTEMEALHEACAKRDFNQINRAFPAVIRLMEDYRDTARSIQKSH